MTPAASSSNLCYGACASTTLTAWSLTPETPLSAQEVLLQQVTQQGDNLHFVALAAAQVEAADMPDIAKTLVQDLEVR